MVGIGDPAYDLLWAIVSRWRLDARGDPAELASLAEYLGIYPRALDREIKGRRSELPFGDDVPRACSG
jgi:aminoglycoside phosphotransferase (APT) family kinase protein